MSTEDGTITAWAQRVSGSNATIVVDNSGSGAIYKGLAIARATNGAPQIYGANFHAGVVDVSASIRPIVHDVVVVGDLDVVQVDGTKLLHLLRYD